MPSEANAPLRTAHGPKRRRELSMAGGQQTYSGGGLTITGLIEHLGREAGRFNGVPGGRASAPGARPQSESQGSRYGQLYAPPAADLAELRRQQAEFDRTRREIALRNGWMAAPALAPAIAPALVEGAAVLAHGARIAPRLPGPLNLHNREVLQRIIRQAYSRDERNRLREQARLVFERANGIPARKMESDVHHSDPLQWAHLKPEADPNRLANLWALPPKEHNLATQQWRAFDRSLQGRTPSHAELMAAKLRIDRSVQEYVRRPGLSRWKIPPKDGGSK